MNPNDLDLLPCPFCGGPASLVRDHDGHGLETRDWAVKCDDCSAFLPWPGKMDQDDPQTAAANWNSRISHIR